MGLRDELLRHVGVEAAAELGLSKEQRQEKGKWGAFFAVFALLSLAAFYIQKHSMDDADLLGGKKTIEKFMHSNFTAMLLLLAAALGFIVAFFKSWKGRRSSIYQLIFTFGALMIIVFSGVSIFKSIHNINKDLNAPITVTADNYVLCSKNGKYMLAFDEEGTTDGILLVIPEKKYKELQGGKPSTKTYTSRAWRLIENDQYDNYEDPAFYGTKIDITYYKYSVIYENVSFAELKTDKNKA